MELDHGRLLASIAATSHDCILSLDDAGTVLWASPATLDVLGWRPEDLSGTNVSVLTTRLGGDRQAEHLGRVLLGERVPPFVDELVRRDGRTVKASVNLGPVHDADGSVTAVTMILRDVTIESREQRPWSNAIVLDAELRLLEAAASVAWLLGGADRLGPDAWRAAVHPDDVSETGRVLLRVVAEPWRTERVVVRLRDGVGHWRPMEHVVTNRLDDPEVRGLLVTLRDASAQVRQEDALRLSEALHRALVERTHEGILALAPDGSTSFANDRAAELLGLPPTEVYAVDVLELLGLASWEADGGSVEVRHVDRAGRERVLELKRCPLTGPSADVLGSLVTVADVTEARLVESTLRRQALHDPLTGLPNRYLFLDRLGTAAARSLRAPGRGTAVLFLDLDGFKPINDGHGHAAGDEILRQVAARLAAAVRATDTVGRLGGDEFAVLCEDVDETGAVVLAAKILGELQRPVLRGTEPHRVGVSIGVAMAPPHPFDELLTRSDRAMYRAKQLGGGRIAVARADDVPDVAGVDEAVH